MNPPTAGRLWSREYLTLPSAGNPDTCDSVHHRASGVLRTWYAAGLIQGYAVRVLSTPEDIVEEDRAFDRLPILADALLDAGCENEVILAHCHSVGPHVRGCWPVDLVLGKG